jgi:hypothetical protein
MKDYMKVEDGGVHFKILKALARNNELEFQRLFGHHPLWGEDPHVEYPLIRHL